MRVGFVGLGAMGAPMADNLVKRDEVTVFARRQDAMAPLVANGTRPLRRCRRAAGRRSPSRWCSTRHPSRRSRSARAGSSQALVAGSIVVDHSTNRCRWCAADASALQARGVSMLDAPVSGGAMAAAIGTLSIMVGGDEAALGRVRPRSSATPGPLRTSDRAVPVRSRRPATRSAHRQHAGRRKAMLLAERAASIGPITDVILTGFDKPHARAAGTEEDREGVRRQRRVAPSRQGHPHRPRHGEDARHQAARQLRRGKGADGAAGRGGAKGTQRPCSTCSRIRTDTWQCISNPEVLDYLDTQRAGLMAAVKTVPPALTSRRPSPDRWSATQVVSHLGIVRGVDCGIDQTAAARGACRRAGA